MSCVSVTALRLPFFLGGDKFGLFLGVHQVRVVGEVAVQMQLAVAEAVQAQVDKLRMEFAKREQMLMQAVMSHAEREKDLADRVAALEQRIASCSPDERSACQ